MARLIAEATEALSQLDVPALEELGCRAEALAALGLDLGLDLGDSGPGSRATDPALDHRFRLFASLLKATGDNLAALRRAESQHSFGGQGFGASEALPLNGYGMPALRLRDSFEPCTREDAVDSVWPRGRMAQARARRDQASGKAANEAGPGRA